MVRIYKQGHYKNVPEKKVNHFQRLGYEVVSNQVEEPQEVKTEEIEELKLEDMTKNEIMEQLKELNIPFSVTSKKAELLELLEEVVSNG